MQQSLGDLSENHLMTTTCENERGHAPAMTTPETVLLLSFPPRAVSQDGA